MAYNYDRELLAVHRETVEQLKELAKHGTRARLVYEHPKDLRAARYLINNLLRVLTFYHPEHQQIRTHVRTWSEYEDEKWVLYVGNPGDIRVKGPRPKPFDLGPMVDGIAKVAEATAPHQRFERVIRPDDGSWSAFGDFVAKAKVTTLEIEAEFSKPLSYEGPHYDPMFPGWWAQVIGDLNTVLLLTRGSRPDDQQ